MIGQLNFGSRFYQQLDVRIEPETVLLHFRAFLLAFISVENGARTRDRRLPGKPSASMSRPISLFCC